MNKYNDFMIQRQTITPNTGPTNVRTKSIINNNFQEILDKKIAHGNELTISKHAQDRMKERNINLTQNQMERVNVAVSKAGQKGVKESLVLVDDVALVVSIKNNTVITAVGSNELKENVFTNIDGAVII